MVLINFCDLQCTNETALSREGQHDTEGCLEVSELLKTLFTDKLKASSFSNIYSSLAKMKKNMLMSLSIYTTKAARMTM